MTPIYLADTATEHARRLARQFQLPILSDLPDSGEYLRDWTAEAVERALTHLQPTGIPFLDLCALKGRLQCSCWA